MDITPGYNPIEKRVLVSVKTNLLERYLPNFIGLMKSKKGMPKDLEVDVGESGNEAVISFPLPKNSKIMDMDDSGVGKIGIDRVIMDRIHNSIMSFVDTALGIDLKSTEFIPLEGYSIDNLREEIQDAVKEGRRLCIIKSYSEYEKMKHKKVYKFHQYIVNSEDEDYSDLALMVYSGEIDEIREKYGSKLSLVEWI